MSSGYPTWDGNNKVKLLSTGDHHDRATRRERSTPMRRASFPFIVWRSLVGYDAFHLAARLKASWLNQSDPALLPDQLLTQPLRLIAGSRDKRLHIVEGATHIAMYDTPEYVKEAMDQLVLLYKNAGKVPSANNYLGPLTAHTATEVGASAA